MTELRAQDFSFQGDFGSQGARIEQVGRNHFRVVPGHAPGHPEWSNSLQFTIGQHAAGHDLRIDTEFPHAAYAYNSYFLSWSYDKEHWHPVHWLRGTKLNVQGEPCRDSVFFPEFRQDTVFVASQVPLSNEQLEAALQRYARSPLAGLHHLGDSMEGRPVYRLSLSDDTAAAGAKKAHFFANQHPLEHNAQWRMLGMIDWLLSGEAADFLKKNVCHFVVKMCPDGTANGWLRVNAQGHDMNSSYYAEGITREGQPAHEAQFVQRDLADLAEQTPLETVWSCHTWQGPVETMLLESDTWEKQGRGEALRRQIVEHGHKGLVMPLKITPKLDEATYRRAPQNFRRSLYLVPDERWRSWATGPYGQYGVSTFLCEGGGALTTREDNLESGRILIKALSCVT